MPFQVEISENLFPECPSKCIKFVIIFKFIEFNIFQNCKISIFIILKYKI